MIPTNKLRFVERVGPFDQFGNRPTILVLQQWWEGSRGRGEWRDVPLEEEV
jgi:hypothetical protein